MNSHDIILIIQDLYYLNFHNLIDYALGSKGGPKWAFFHKYCDTRDTICHKIKVSRVLQLKKSIARFGFVKRTIVFRFNQIPYNLNLKQYVYGKPIRKNLLYKLKIRKCD